ncbi:nuclear GTPase SLIP-GC-like isoform X1 [Anabas testudineus]|uniref:nuclear GTPase SLIP-GC-like isoform X1 n=1 Tax=Anabas testudineus TaxID=64144 RepID=UPI000E45F8A8|nr:nuclear GTPase SLIP-GC-like isoform X1 [Anabas testudineus]
MDDFVCKKLTEWGLSDWIERFKDEGIDKESLECLEDQEIDHLIPKVGPRSKFKKRLKLFKEEQNTAHQEAEIVSPTHLQREQEEAVDSDQGEQSTAYQEAEIISPTDLQLEQEEEVDSDQAGPSTSDTSDKGKRKLDFQGETPAKKRQRDTIGSYSEEIILSKVKRIMGHVYESLHSEENTKLNAFLKTKVCDLDTDKRELVGVFGKTGAGKSSLINAIIGEFNLLPSGSIKACTSVMIKVEANMHNPKYEAEIEFITNEEWKDELWSLCNILENDQEKEDNEDYRDTVEKLSALYGEEWRNIPPENLMDNKYFREIPEFLYNKRKILTCETARELSAKFIKYTRSDSRDGEGKEVKRWYWPLVKCVTVRVPNNHLLQHVTLVDLPGSGDRNKSRDRMWKEFVGNCSTVWIVTEINRAAAEKEPWEILESACSLMGNGGQCQQIHFICTKSDLLENWDDHSKDAIRTLIFKSNMEAKEEVQKEFSKLNNVKKHFSDDCLKVFTVSSKEFKKKKNLQQDETEIPKIQKFLQNLNDCHSETLNYVSGACGILSLIQGSSCRDMAGSKADVCSILEEKLRNELNHIRESMDETYEAFEKCLNEGVEKSKGSCEVTLRPILRPKKKDLGFHRTLKCVVENSGIHKTGKGKQINLNSKLSSWLTDSIDEEFKKTFPNEGKCGPFNGVISSFSLNTEELIEKYKDVELQLIFLKTEEEKIKKKLSKIIRNGKKLVYCSLTGTVEQNMQECYEKAAEFTGRDTLKNMRETIEKHLQDSKNIIFKHAKKDMLHLLKKLMEEIMETLEKTLNEAIELSLKTDDHSIPDYSTELELVKQYYEELEGSRDEEM